MHNPTGTRAQIAQGTMMKEFKLTAAQEQCLRDQAITDDQPGPVLRDFRMLLDFLGTEGVEAGGKYNLLPIKLIGGAGRPPEPAPSPGIEATAAPVAPLPARAEPAAAGLRPQPRRGHGRQGPPGPRPGHAGAVGPAQPHGAILQLARSLAPVRPRGDGRGTGLARGATC